MTLFKVICAIERYLALSIFNWSCMNFVTFLPFYAIWYYLTLSDAILRYLMLIVFLRYKMLSNAFLHCDTIWHYLALCYTILDFFLPYVLTLSDFSDHIKYYLVLSVTICSNHTLSNAMIRCLTLSYDILRYLTLCHDNFTKCTTTNKIYSKG